MGNRYEDRADIIDLMTTYQWAMENKTFDDMRSVFTTDASVNIRGFECEGREQIIFRLAAAVTRFARLQHVTGNHLVTVDGDQATHRCQMIVQQSADGRIRGSNYIVGCHSDGRLVRTEDGWRYTSLVVTEIWAEGVFDPTLD